MSHRPKRKKDTIKSRRRARRRKAARRTTAKPSRRTSPRKSRTRRKETPTRRQVELAAQITKAGGKVSFGGETGARAVSKATRAEVRGTKPTAAAPTPTREPTPIPEQPTTLREAFTEPTAAGATPTPEGETQALLRTAETVPIGGVGVGGARTAARTIVTGTNRQTVNALANTFRSKGLTLEFSRYSGKAFTDAAKALLPRTKTPLNTKIYELTKQAIFNVTKVAKNPYVIAGAIASYIFSTGLTFNIKDDFSRAIGIEAGAAEREGDVEGLRNMIDMHKDLENSMNDLRGFTGVFGFIEQTYENIKGQGEILEQKYERAAGRTITEEQNAAADGNEQQRKYWETVNKERDDRRERERREDEEYYKRIRAASDARRRGNDKKAAQQRKEAEEYWAEVWRQRLAFYAEQARLREENAPSQLGFGFLGR